MRLNLSSLRSSPGFKIGEQNTSGMLRSLTGTWPRQDVEAFWRRGGLGPCGRHLLTPNIRACLLPLILSSPSSLLTSSSLPTSPPPHRQRSLHQSGARTKHDPVLWTNQKTELDVTIWRWKTGDPYLPCLGDRPTAIRQEHILIWNKKCYFFRICVSCMLFFCSHYCSPVFPAVWSCN